MVKANKVYAVKRGRKPGIYSSWEECNLQVKGFGGAVYKGFTTREEAEKFLNPESLKPLTAQLKAQGQGCSSSTRQAGKAEDDGYYVVEFDGASKGNPGRAGAGALLRSPNGAVVSELSEGLGVATNNVAEYRGMILGLNMALSRGVQRIIVRGDSKLVCEQVTGTWNVKHEGLKPLWEEAMALRNKFLDFRMEHVDREFNPRADELANIGVSKPATEMRKLSQLETKEEKVGTASEQMPGEPDVIVDGLYVLEFDGASKGNPGKAGAGALLRSPNGAVICELCEGLGVATNNVAEYRGLILGLRAAVYRGVKRIIVRGDSKLVCQQVMETWHVKNEGLKPLVEEAKLLRNKFDEFRVEHVEREFNPRADALANNGVSQPVSEWSSWIQ